MSAEQDKQGSAPQPEVVLDSERAVNEDYMDKIDKRSNQALRGNINTPMQAVSGALAFGPLVGRVAFVEADRDLGDGFYVGPSFAHLDDDRLVLSWNAPMSRAFYTGDAVGAPPVASRRTFSSSDSDLIAFGDDLLPGVKPRNWFNDGRRTLKIPEPPTSPPRPPEPHLVEASGAATVNPVPEIDDRDVTIKIQSAEVSVRGEQALVTSMDRPKDGRMHAVLSTLQADQYEAVAAPAGRLLVVQGGPGTGKSIVAAHRAAYLTLPSNEGAPAFKEVLLLGPTRNYVKHVRPTLTELAVDQSVRLYSVQELVKQFSRHQHSPPAQHSDPTDVSWDLWLVAQRLVRDLKTSLRGSTRQQLRTVIDAAANDAAIRESACALVGPEIADWLEALGSYSRASKKRRYALFFAAVCMNLSPPPPKLKYAHIIVDEAQDLRSLDWILVDALLRKTGTLTLLGDLHQRRSDHTPATWHEIVDRLELVDNIEQFEPVLLQTSYRTTRQILKFAGQLLPRGQRNLPSLSSGPEPDLTGMGAASPADSARSAIRLLRRSLQQFPGASAAIVSADVPKVNVALRSAGFARHAEGLPFTLDDEKIIVLSSDEARGLEFDVVAVHEPAEFRQNFGRHGALFTALTRASKHLIVTGSGKLPRELGG